MSQPQQGTRAFLSEAKKKLKSGAWWTGVVVPMVLRTLAYLVCTGFASLIPLALLAKSADLFDYHFLARGDLLIISLVLIIGAFGDLIYSLCSAESKNWRMVLGCVVLGQVLAGGACAYAYVRGGAEATNSTGQTTTYGDVHYVGFAQLALLTFAVALLLGWCTLIFKSAAGGG